MEKFTFFQRLLKISGPFQKNCLFGGASGHLGHIVIEASASQLVDPGSLPYLAISKTLKLIFTAYLPTFCKGVIRD